MIIFNNLRWYSVTRLFLLHIVILQLRVDLWENIFFDFLDPIKQAPALKEKRPQYQKRHDKVILQHDNAQPHIARPVKTYTEKTVLPNQQKYLVSI